MFILGVFSCVDALHAACLQPACRASTPECRASTPECRASTPCTWRRRRECARVFQWRRLHLKRNAACMQPACRLHAGCCNLQPPAYDRMQAACSLHAACMQPACISSVALALRNAFLSILTSLPLTVSHWSDPPPPP